MIRQWRIDRKIAHRAAQKGARTRVRARKHEGFVDDRQKLRVLYQEYLSARKDRDREKALRDWDAIQTEGWADAR